MSLAQPECPLTLPFTGQSLRRAVECGDQAVLMDFAHQLRIAGYRVEPQRLALDLLTHGCTWLTDRFGQRVALHVQVPSARRAMATVDEHTPFRIAA